jgi:UDP-2-acetamido-2,6-beta-L-arabino-hexul-4-ose reductase
MSSDAGAVTVTGAEGFIGRNLRVRLEEHDYDVLPITRSSTKGELRGALECSSAVFHLAGVNRPDDPADYLRVNGEFTAMLAGAIAEAGRTPLVVYASSERAAADDPYGRSKLAGEQALQALGSSARISIWRLPNVFGKWSRPNYNSVVATFCHNLARGLPLRVDDPRAPLTLLYIDDLLDQWMPLLEGLRASSSIEQPRRTHVTTVGDLAAMLERIALGRAGGEVEQVGAGLYRALYATYLSFLPAEQFAYPLPCHHDQRGSFLEFLRTRDSGQFAVLKAYPGQTRGEHYHHTKAEKMLVVHGEARFRFRHVDTGETLEFNASEREPIAIETIPGWAHDITNTGETDLIVVVWASEAFDRSRPDTVASPP